MSEKGSKKKIWEVDPVYINYLSSHHPEAIEFVKRNAEVIKNKRNIWLDIQNYTEFSDKASDGSILPGTRKVILFKKIIFDIFPRKLKPQYIGEDTDYNRYITWITATEDIRAQRSSGYKGERWIVECSLDIHKTQSQTKKVLIPATRIYKNNPAYSAYQNSQTYKKYKIEKAAYEARLSDYNKYRRTFQEFHLPDGTIKKVLFYMRAEEKFEMLRSLGVSEAEIQESRKRLEKPVEPVPPPTPPRQIAEYIQAHYAEETVPGKWVWDHSIKAVRRA